MQLKFREKAFMKHIAKNILVVLVASLVVVDSSFATDGYFLTGYGAKQQGPRRNRSRVARK